MSRFDRSEDSGRRNVRCQQWTKGDRGHDVEQCGFSASLCRRGDPESRKNHERVVGMRSNRPQSERVGRPSVENHIATCRIYDAVEQRRPIDRLWPRRGLGEIERVASEGIVDTPSGLCDELIEYTYAASEPLCRRFPLPLIGEEGE